MKNRSKVEDEGKRSGNNTDWRVTGSSGRERGLGGGTSGAADGMGEANFRKRG